MENLNTNDDQRDKAALGGHEGLGEPTDLICPKCGNMLGQLDDGELSYFCCSLGHTYSAYALLTEQMTVLKVALWNELQALKEKQLRLTRK